jgi:hypothetical protein
MIFCKVKDQLDLTGERFPADGALTVRIENRLSFTLNVFIVVFGNDSRSVNIFS